MQAQLPRRLTFSEISGSKLATNIPFYSAQSSVAPVSCCLLAGYSHTCCEDLLRGATGCCSRVATELVLCSLSTAQRHNATQDFVHRGARVALCNSSGERRVENRLEHKKESSPQFAKVSC